ncbi:adenosylcobinamide-GDP ribazoletransferase [Sulfitobacter sp. F26204]|uniref:adenosylcobinamide-GDP ribazoletransferase n=1 Tax=Sulfitobacter sp. F26204 TaxID=2996014 RepID=UPI00225E27EA|nr:adenosylcobinamide-GDP ribazoletransferase [Sulfitobacter sp. F26204]MCX7560888.1 adenosylcobinamide-GDP ribazoletransferase [Sulfitobacter sp. F26204]
MNGNDITDFRPRPADLITAMSLLTRLPLPAGAQTATGARPMAFAAWAYPLVGIVVACLAATVGWAAFAIHLPATVAAMLVLLTGIVVTGAMHEDGLADCADGFWGGWTRTRRLEIMKDSLIGTYGVIALILGLGLKWLAMSALLDSGVLLAALLASAVISRAAMVGLMFALPNARRSGLSQQTGRPPRGAVMIAGVIGLITLLFLTPAPIGLSVLMITAALFSCGIIAKAKIAGQTGDVLGATQQITEITVLLACLTALP